MTINPWRRSVQWIFALIYLTLIILTVPLAFDVGGEDCGIAFTFTLTVFYLVMSTIRIISRNTKLSIIGSLFYYTQHIIIPSLLILHLSLFSSTGDESTPLYTWLNIIHPWKVFVKNSTPLFTILEGFCTLLVIQATGHIMRYLIHKKSDNWMFVQIINSGCIITTSLYFLYRIYTFPVVLDLGNATLIGSVLTISIFLGIYGIVSGRGSAIESSLLFSYVVYCLYLTFTDFQSSITSDTFTAGTSSSSSSSSESTASRSWWSLPVISYLLAPMSTSPYTNFFNNVGGGAAAVTANPSNNNVPPMVDIPPLPPIIISGYTNFVSTVAELIPQGFVTVYDVFKGAFSTITPSVVVSLAYRLGVFYAATRIIPALDAVSNRRQQQEKPHSKSRALIFIIYAYAPCIIIAVYTHLLMHHFGILSTAAMIPDTTLTQHYPQLREWICQLYSDPQISWQFWGWINMFTTLTLYWLELAYGKPGDGEPLMMESHFKQE